MGTKTTVNEIPYDAAVGESMYQLGQEDLYTQISVRFLIDRITFNDTNVGIYILLWEYLCTIQNACSSDALDGMHAVHSVAQVVTDRIRDLLPNTNPIVTSFIVNHVNVFGDDKEATDQIPNKIVKYFENFSSFPHLRERRLFIQITILFSFIKTIRITETAMGGLQLKVQNKTFTIGTASMVYRNWNISETISTWKINEILGKAMVTPNSTLATVLASANIDKLSNKLVVAAIARRWKIFLAILVTSAAAVISAISKFKSAEKILSFVNSLQQNSFNPLDQDITANCLFLHQNSEQQKRFEQACECKLDSYQFNSFAVPDNCEKSCDFVEDARAMEEAILFPENSTANEVNIADLSHQGDSFSAKSIRYSLDLEE